MSTDTAPVPASDVDTVVTDDTEALDATTLSDFVGRHVGPREDDVAAMLQTLGYDSLEALVDAAVPGGIRAGAPLSIAAAPSEQAVLGELRELASRNTVLTSMIGLGYYGTQTPPVVLRNVLENPAWYTAYTPYQPEISQGRLEALLTFQTMVGDLTGLPIAGASLLDEGTAAAEATALMRRASKVADDAVLLLDEKLFPQTRAVVTTRARAMGWDVVDLDLTTVTDAAGLRVAAGDREVFGVIVQHPGSDGQIRDWSALTAAAHEAGALVTAAADLLALTLLTPPGAWGADVAVGTTQRFGVPMGFGGPHAGYMSVREGLEFGTTIETDSTPLTGLVQAMLAAGPGLHALRDPTRGGLATSLNEIASASGVGVDLDEGALPVPEPVANCCSFLGLDPMYVANEGKLVVVCAADVAGAALAALRAHPFGAAAARIGTVVADERCFVQLRTALGGRRMVDWLAAEQLPRIC